MRPGRSTAAARIPDQHSPQVRNGMLDQELHARGYYRPASRHPHRTIYRRAGTPGPNSGRLFRTRARRYARQPVGHFIGVTGDPLSVRCHRRCVHDATGHARPPAMESPAVQAGDPEPAPAEGPFVRQREDDWCSMPVPAAVGPSEGGDPALESTLGGVAYADGDSAVELAGRPVRQTATRGEGLGPSGPYSGGMLCNRRSRDRPEAWATRDLHCRP